MLNNNKLKRKCLIKLVKFNAAASSSQQSHKQSLQCSNTLVSLLPSRQSFLLFEALLLLIPSETFKVTTGLHLAGHLFAAVPEDMMSSALFDHVLYCPYSGSLGTCPVWHNNPSVTLQVSDMLWDSALPFQLPENSTAELTGKLLKRYVV